MKLKNGLKDLARKEKEADRQGQEQTEDRNRRPCRLMENEFKPK